MSFWSKLFRNPQPNRKPRPIRRSRLTLESLDERALPSNTYAFLGSASSYGLMAFNNGNLSMVGQSSVLGDVGVGNNVNVTGRNSSITGTLFAANNARLQLANTFSVSGGVVRQNMAAAINDAVAASNALANLAPTQNFNNNVTNSLTLNGNGGMNVVRMKSLNYQNDTLTLSGNAMDVFVVNVRGDFTFRNSHIVLQGGVTADHVIFNFTSNNANVTFRNANSDVVGTFLNTRGSVDYQNAAHFQGAIFARTVSMHVNADLDNGNGTSTGGTGSITGVTNNDSTGDGHFTLGENGLGGVTVTLTGIDDQGTVVTMSVVSDVDGNFSFTNLRAGTYTLTESLPPSGWSLSGGDTGSAGGTFSGDSFSAIVLGNGVQALSYYFNFVSGGGPTG